MFGDFAKGDSVSVEYESGRSGNTVSRTGTVEQTPGDGKRGFFVKTGDDQLLGVLSDRVYSLTVDWESDPPSIERKTFLGEFEAVSDA